jgi:hypothetical protein
MLGVLNTYINYCIKTNSFKTVVMKGVNAKELPEDLIFDQLFPFRFTGDTAQVSALDLSVDPRPVAEVVAGKLNALVNAYGVNADLYRASNTSASGYALKLSRRELDENRATQIAQYKAFEHELFRVTRIVNNTKLKDKISDKAEFFIDFNEMSIGDSAADIREQWKFDISIGAKSVIDYIRYLNPDMSEEEAEEALIKARRVNATKKAGLDIDGILSRVTSGPQQ